MFLFNHNRKYPINKKYIQPKFLYLSNTEYYDIINVRCEYFSWFSRPSWKLKHWKRNVPDLPTKDTTRRRTILKTVNIQNNNNTQNDAPDMATIFFL